MTLRAVPEPARQDGDAGDIHNIEIEQALLGVLLAKNEAVHQVSRLQSEHFYDPVHARIYGRIVDRVTDGRLASPITLKADMEKDEGLADLGGPGYLVRLYEAAIVVRAAPDYADEIIHCWVRRRVVDLGRTLGDWAQKPQSKLKQVAAEVEGQLLDLRNSAERKPISSSFLAAATSSINDIAEMYQSDGAAGVRTSLKALDEILGGLREKRLIILGGRPGMGKTSTALAIANGICSTPMADGRPQGGIFVTAEMTREELMARFWSMKLREMGRNVPYFLIEDGKLSEDDFRAVCHLAKEYQDFPLRIEEPPSNTLSDVLTSIRRSAKAFSDESPLRVVVVDYLQLVNVPGADRFEQPGRVTKALKEVSGEVGAPIVLLSQLSRSIENRDYKNRRPVMNDLRNSGEIEEDAHAIVFCYRSHFYMMQEAKAASDPTERAVLEEKANQYLNGLDLIVAKNRSGPTGTAPMYIDLAHNIVRDVDGYGQENPF